LQQRVLRTPASYFGSLGSRSGEEGRGKWRGDQGLFIVAAGALIWRGSEWNLREGGVTASGEQRSPAWLVAGGRRRSDRWVRPVSRKREGRGYRFGVRLVGPQAETRAGPDWLPGAFFIFLFLFFFLLFRFLIPFRFCILNPNDFKPVANVF
jgi:hypothetical protein